MFTRVSILAYPSIPRIPLSIMNNTSNGSDLSCFEQYDNTGFVIVVGLRVAGGIISFFCCLVMIWLIIIFKKYKFFTQRLILYLALSALAYSVVSAINVEGFRSYRDDSVRSYCVFVGFLEQVVGNWIPVAITCIMVDLFVKVVFDKPTEKFEILYILLIFVSPILYSWIPFIHVAYGPAGAWCWIRDVDYECNDFPFGTSLRFALYWVPLYILMPILFGLLIIILVLLRKRQKQWIGNFNPESIELKKRMQEEVIPLLYYPIIFLLLNIFPFGNRISNAIQSEPLLPLWILAAISLPFQGLVITLAFALDSETRRKMTIPHILVATKHLFVKDERMQEYPIGREHFDGLKYEEKEREIIN